MNSEQLTILTNIIGGVESGGQIYGNRKYGAYAAAGANNENEVTCTLGWAQNYGYNARDLCKRILDRDPEAFRSADTAGIEAMLAKDWVAAKWNPTSKQKAALIAIITTDAGKAVQDEMFVETAKKYIEHAEAYGVTDTAAQMMWCEIEHLGGLAPTKRIFGRAVKPYTPDTIYASLLQDQFDTSNNNQVGDKIYQSRHQCCVLWIKKYVACNEGKEEVPMNEIDKIYAVAEEEIGYLEKKSNAYLDDKTKNAGYNNFTKYWRDLRKEGMMKVYGYSTSSSFAGGSNWPYCAAGIFWCFMQALGVQRAQELLLHNGAAFINCETMHSKAKAAGKLISRPRAGAIVLFKKSNGVHYHTEFCYAVKDGIMYTIGFNTSGASTVISNGGGVCAKRYVISSTNADYFMPDYDTSTGSTNTSTGSTDTLTGNSNTSTNSTVIFTGTSVTLLKYGSQGTAVKDMQIKLIALGYSCGSCGADGDFGSGTLVAVKAFQQGKELTVDGIYGEKTASALNITYQNKINSKTSDPVNASRLFVGKIKKDGVDVRTWAGREYGNIKSWPKLNAGNLVDVLDYTQTAADGEKWYFVRIANKYHGFVLTKYIERV